MRAFRICIALIAFVYGCGLLQTRTRNTTSDYALEQRKQDLKVSAELEKSGSFHMLDMGRDSLNSTYRILLWPKGSFTFSPEMGFVGEAEKIEMSGTLEQLKAYSAMVNNQTAEKVKVKAALKEQEKKALEKKQVTVSAAYSLKWLIAGTVLIGAAGFWVYRKIK